MAKGKIGGRNVNANGGHGRMMAEIDIKAILIRENVRDHESDDGIPGLADTIKRDGLIHPITVYPDGDKYFIEDGHRRFAAIKLLASRNEWHEPVMCILETTPRESKGIHARQAIANLQREDLTSMERAKLVARMVDEWGSQERTAQILGKSDAWVSEAVAAAHLARANPEAADLTKRVAVEISRAPEPAKKQLIQDAIKGNSSVRQVRAAVSKAKGKKPTKKPGKPADPPGVKVAKQFIRVFGRLSPDNKTACREYLRANFPDE